MFVNIDVERETLEEVLILEVEAVPNGGRSYHAKPQSCGRSRVTHVQLLHRHHHVGDK